MDAYEIRLELLKMSQSMLMDQWNRQQMALENEYFQKREMAMSTEYNKEFVAYPDLPPIPTTDDIVNLANKFNDFVSRRV